jgi:hypothetical protein
MKKLLFLLTVVFFVACKKDSFDNEQVHHFQFFENGSETDFVLFNSMDNSFKANLSMKLSVVLSSVINDNENLRNLLLQEFITNDFQ